MNMVYLNGRWIAAAEASVSVFDRGFLFGDGVYEVIPVYAGKLFLAVAHLERLARSLAAVAIELPEYAQLPTLLNQLIAQQQLQWGLVYLQVTRGSDVQRSHLPTQPLRPTLFMCAQASPPPIVVPAPIRVVSMSDFRWQRGDIKGISLLGATLIKQAAQHQGVGEALLHREQQVTEGSACNYFFVRDGVLFTPPADQQILAGITRDWIIELARANHISVQETSISLSAAYQADECFLTSSSRVIQPVYQIDDKLIGTGTVGPLTQRLCEYAAAQIHADPIKGDRPDAKN